MRESWSTSAQPWVLRGSACLLRTQEWRLWSPRPFASFTSFSVVSGVPLHHKLFVDKRHEAFLRISKQTEPKNT